MPGKRYSRIIPVSGIPIEAGNMKPRAKKTIVTTTIPVINLNTIDLQP
jgi:hypothetical protein